MTSCFWWVGRQLLTDREDADARVDALKARMEALKKRREARAAGEGGEKAKGKSIAALAMAKKNKGKK